MITTLIIIYLLSTVGFYKITQKLSRNKNYMDFLFMIIPFVNTFSIFCWFKVYLSDKIDWNKFFNRW